MATLTMIMCIIYSELTILRCRVFIFTIINQVIPRFETLHYHPLMFTRHCCVGVSQPPETVYQRIIFEVNCVE